jgi:hypothetical protein
MEMKSLKIIVKTVLAFSAVLVIGGCNMNQVSNPLPDTARKISEVEDLMKLKAFNTCRDEGLQHDANARSRGVPGGFLTSARVISSCTAELGRAGSRVDPEERMRITALSVVNYLKGGEVETARRQFEKFKANWPNHDLYLAGGVSFIETADALFGRAADQTFGQFTAMNINDEVKSEMRRLNHWKNK